MSERNTALLLSGHIAAADILRTMQQVPGVGRENLTGEEAVRIGHATRDGYDYTFIGWRLFELGGLLLLDRLPLPGDDEPEMHLGRSLAGQFGQAVFVHYDEEVGYGGSAVFERGMLIDRNGVDGRWDEPLVRTLNEEHVLTDLDPSDWIWPRLGDAVETGASVVLGPGVRNDDDIEKIIAATDPQVHEPADDAPTTPEAPEPERTRKRDRVFGALKGLFKR